MRNDGGLNQDEDGTVGENGLHLEYILKVDVMSFAHKLNVCEVGLARLSLGQFEAVPKWVLFKDERRNHEAKVRTSGP